MTASLDALDAAVSGWLAKAEGPFILGLCGAQGSGKTTLSSGLRDRLRGRGLSVGVLSLDDLYLSRAGRAERATIHPLFVTRGVPGTHDVALGQEVLDDVRDGRPSHLPRFDKAEDEPVAKTAWPAVEAGLDLLIFEGWCVGARAQATDDLIEPINDLERQGDPDGMWRESVNAALETDYADLFARIDRLVLIAAPGFEIVWRWRTEQEDALRRRVAEEGRPGTAVMDAAAISRFIQHYERLTRHILNEMPPRADLVLHLDEDRQLRGVS